MPGQENFSGTIVHPQKWTPEHDRMASGKRVALIGSGATAVTILPGIKGRYIYDIRKLFGLFDPEMYALKIRQIGGFLPPPQYTLRRPLMGEVLSTRIWGVPPAGGPLL